MNTTTSFILSGHTKIKQILECLYRLARSTLFERLVHECAQQDTKYKARDELVKCSLLYAASVYEVHRDIQHPATVKRVLFIIVFSCGSSAW